VVRELLRAMQRAGLDSLNARLLDSFHLALVAHVIYYYGVSNWGDLFVVIKTVW
jgi:hypothetical protein